MSPVSLERFLGNLALPCVPLLVVFGLIASLFPVASACGGTGKRPQTKKVLKPKKPQDRKQGSGSSAAMTSVGHGASSRSSRRRPTSVSSSNSGTPPARGPSPNPTVVAAPSQPPATIEEQIVALTNQDRRAHGLPPLSVDGRLTVAAQIQAGAMAAYNVLEHILPGAAYPTQVDRLIYVGYNFAWSGENIAFNSRDASAVETLWMNSPTHRENILSPYPTSIGVAVAYDGRGEPYYCVEFGASQ